MSTKQEGSSHQVRARRYIFNSGIFGIVFLCSIVLAGCNRTADTTQTSTPPPTLPSPTENNMSFFVTSVGLGNGGNLGGLTGADQQCQKLANSVGAGQKTWRAYLSTQGVDVVNARDRIGSGPWMNAKGVIIAQNLTELHQANNITKQTTLTEKGEVVNGR